MKLNINNINNINNTNNSNYINNNNINYKLYYNESNLLKSVDNFQMHFIEQLARRKRDLLYTSFEFVSDTPELIELFNKIQEDNDLLYFLKANEIQLVKFGTCFIKFEITKFEEETKILLLTAIPSTFNSVAKINNNFKLEFQGVGLFEYTATITGSSLMCIQNFTKDEWVNIPWFNNAVGNVMFNEFFSFKTPDYLLDYNKYFKVRNATNGQLPITQLVNMELPVYHCYTDAELAEAKQIYNLQQSEHPELNNDMWLYYLKFTDWWVCRQLLNVYNYVPNWMSWELITNQTKIIGNVDFTSLTRIMQQFNNNNLAVNPELIAILARQFIKSDLANPNSNISLLQGGFDGNNAIMFLNSFNQYLFSLCGYGTTTPIQSSYNETVAKTKQLDNELATTIRHYKSLREEQYKRFFDRIVLSVYPGRKDLLQQYNFLIQSNTLQDTLDDVDRITQMRDYGLIDFDSAVSALNRDKSNLQLDMMKQKLQQEKQAELEAVQDQGETI